MSTVGSTAGSTVVSSSTSFPAHRPDSPGKLYCSSVTNIAMDSGDPDRQELYSDRFIRHQCGTVDVTCPGEEAGRVGDRLHCTAGQYSTAGRPGQANTPGYLQRNVNNGSGSGSVLHRNGWTHHKVSSSQLSLHIVSQV